MIGCIPDHSMVSIAIAPTAAESGDSVVVTTTVEYLIPGLGDYLVSGTVTLTYGSNTAACVLQYRSPSASCGITTTPLNAGEYVVSARYDGDAFVPSGDSQLQFTVARCTPAVTIRFGGPLISGSTTPATLDVSSSCLTIPSGTATGCGATCQLDANGSCEIVADWSRDEAGTTSCALTYAGDSENAPASSSVDVTLQ